MTAKVKPAEASAPSVKPAPGSDDWTLEPHGSELIRIEDAGDREIYHLKLSRPKWAGQTAIGIRQHYSAQAGAILADELEKRFRDLIGQADFAAFTSACQRMTEARNAKDPRALGGAIASTEPVRKQAAKDLARLFTLAMNAVDASGKVRSRDLANGVAAVIGAMLPEALLAGAFAAAQDIRVFRDIGAGVAAEFGLPGAVEPLPPPPAPPPAVRPKQEPAAPAPKPEEWAGGVRTVPPEESLPGVHPVRSGNPV